MRELSIDELYSYLQSEPNNTNRKLEFYQRILGHDFLVVLENTDLDEDLRPHIFNTEEGRFLLCFENNEKLTNFIIRETTHALLSFKEIIKFVENKKIGIALNLGTKSGVLLDLKAVRWIEQVILTGPAIELSSRPIAFEFPNLVDKNLISKLKIALDKLSGMTKKVVLARARYKDLGVSYFLGFIDSPQVFHELIKERILDIVKLQKSDSVFVDVAFLSSSTELASQLVANGLTMTLPKLHISNKNVKPLPNTGVPKLK